MDLYESLGHMERIPLEELPLVHNYMIPHRAVLRPDSSSTQLRVVFNATCSDGKNPSLNDILMLGPKTQLDLMEILIQFRWFTFVFGADIEKMYGQVLIDSSDQNFQCILWRKTKELIAEIYRLLTVTQGTKPASFLATYCLNILSSELSKTDPVAAKAILKGFYMDNLWYGSDTVEDLIRLQETVHRKLAEGGFPLRKYASNTPELLARIDPDLIESLKKVSLNDEKTISTLGIQWDPSKDVFRFLFDLPSLPEVITKRILLSFVSRLFDPLGFLSPIIIRAKLFIQDVWREELNWEIRLDAKLTIPIHFYQK